MSILAYVILALIALAACGFVAWPILAKRDERGRVVLAAAVALLVLGVGGGLYVAFGHPALAVRTLEGSNAHDLNAVIGRWGKVVQKSPQDPRGWVVLAEGYAAAHDYDDAAKAFGRAVDAAEARGQHLSFLYAAYGEALTQASAGAVTPEAEAAFTKALSLDPKDLAARYYLGLAAAARGDAGQALLYWNSLLGDVPANSPLHAELVDRIAAQRARTVTAPDVGAMVAGLVARLKASPDDAPGWQMLIRAYAVLGDKDKARTALSDARKAAVGRGYQLAALDAEAKELGL